MLSSAPGPLCQFMCSQWQELGLSYFFALLVSSTQSPGPCDQWGPLTFTDNRYLVTANRRLFFIGIQAGLWSMLLCIRYESLLDSGKRHAVSENSKLLYAVDYCSHILECSSFCFPQLNRKTFRVSLDYPPLGRIAGLPGCFLPHYVLSFVISSFLNMGEGESAGTIPSRNQQTFLKNIFY